MNGPHDNTTEQVNFNSTIRNDTVLVDHATVLLLVAIICYAVSEDGVTIGTPGVRVDVGATAAARATVIRDVSPHTTVARVPAEPLVRRSKVSRMEVRS